MGVATRHNPVMPVMPPPPPHRRWDLTGVWIAVAGVLVLIGLGMIGQMNDDEPPSSTPPTHFDGDSQDVVAAEPETSDPVVERSCEIFYDIAADAADNVDSIPETRARYKDLLDGYGVSLPIGMQDALRDIVGALTTVDTTRLEPALTSFASYC